MTDNRAIFKFYVIGDVTHIKSEEKLSIEEFSFNFNDEDDYFLVEDYGDDEETTIDSFPDNCYRYLVEEEINDLSQHMCPSIILTEEQFNIIQSFKSK